MRIGVPAEVKNHEYRVAITPAGVRELTLNGHPIFAQAGAGTGSSITDAEYQAAGAQVLGLSRVCQRRSPLSGQGGGGPVRVHPRGCLGLPCRDRCHLQVVSSGNGAVSPLPTTVETHGTRSRRHQTRPGTGEHHDQELSSRCDEGLRCRP